MKLNYMKLNEDTFRKNYSPRKYCIARLIATCPSMEQALVAMNIPREKALRCTPPLGRSALMAGMEDLDGRDIAIEVTREGLAFVWVAYPDLAADTIEGAWARWKDVLIPPNLKERWTILDYPG